MDYENKQQKGILKFYMEGLMKVRDQIKLTNDLFKAGFCSQIWGINETSKHYDYVLAGEKQRDLNNSAWRGQQRKVLNKIMDIGYGVGIAVAKDCQHVFMQNYTDIYHMWQESELDDFFIKMEEEYNYKLDDVDKELLLDYAYCVISVKANIIQGCDNKEIAERTCLSVEEVRKIRYDEVITGVDVKEHIAVEVVIKKNIEFVIDSLYKNIRSEEAIVNIVEPFLSLDDVEKIDRFKDFPNSKIILNRFKEDLIIKWLEPLYLEENTDKEDIDMEKIKIVREIAYHDKI